MVAVAYEEISKVCDAFSARRYANGGRSHRQKIKQEN